MKLATPRIAASLGLVFLMLAGCAGESGPERPGPPVDPSGDIAMTAAQPFTAFPQEDVNTLNEIRRKLVYRCMAEAGFPAYRQENLAMPARVSSLLNLERHIVGWASERHARAQGFGSDAPPTPVEIVSFDAGHDKLLDGCVADAGARIGPKFKRTIDLATDLANTLSAERVEVFDTAKYKELNASVLACLSGKGFDADERTREDIGARPEAFGVKTGGLAEMSEPVLKREPGTIEVIPAQPARRYVPTAEEADLAAAMFTCQTETGALTDLRTLVNDAQRTAWTRHEDDLANLKTDLTTLLKTATTLL
ncbi:hypothetical protein [Actinocorallia sp. A-T 12471]|uniref:hypothetical protein n=1 Tax=Actinocorallia sp. A-T 12471 TaxID=3089813 RepID=UPI0029D15B4B|nr:hypothetical protein [Actinocorallia sp. A-T 12471]MDX6739993.1 hypothetical protein [Actinocorallia sp. A-T 12471]